MKKMSMLLLSSLLGSLIFTACGSPGGTVFPAPAPAPTASPQPTAEYKSLPTPVSPGEPAVYDELQVVMIQAEFTDSYLTEFGSTREPPAGRKFLWIHIAIKSIGQGEQDLPAPEHFSVLNGTTEYKPTYGHRQDHTDYTSLRTIMVPGQDVDAWLRFDIPAGLELEDLSFAFLPETSQISTGFSSSEHPWGDHPIYLWTCAP